MFIRFALYAAVLATVLLSEACNATCSTTSECPEKHMCVPTLNRCRKMCSTPIECAGTTICAPVNENIYACLDNSEIPKTVKSPSNDTSLGNLCASPNNNGVSTATDQFGACGEGAPLCNAVFTGDPDLGNVKSCTTECSADSECWGKAPIGCVGDCKRDFDNLCCFPSLSSHDTRLYSGAKTNGSGQFLTNYCRPRLFCYYVPKRCTQDSDCATTSNRAEAGKCTKTADGGGACVSGKLGLYECCQRAGECDQSLATGGVGGLSCTAGLDNLSAYCSKPCANDADCASPNAPMASCWTNTFVETSTPGQCRIEADPMPRCRTTPKPQIPNPPSKIVACDYKDRPGTFSDNTYNASLRRCDRTF